MMAQAGVSQFATDRGSDVTAARSYRYLRLAMVALLVCLASAVVYQAWRSSGVLLRSVSAYYYTPAQGIFVGSLIGLGVGMIALEGVTTTEDVLLNVGGVFAAVVAIVPTSRGVDYDAAMRACRESAIPLMTGRVSSQPVCPTRTAVETATRANVENNLSALLVVGAVALLVAVLFARRDGTFTSREVDGRERRRGFVVGFVVAAVLWLAGLVARLAALDWLVTHGHYLAAVGLGVCIFGLALLNSWRRTSARVGDDAADEARQPPGVRQSVEPLMQLVTPGRHDAYIWVARLMVLVTVVFSALMWAGLITVFWLEIAAAALFAAYWTVQTVEKDRAT